MGNDNACWVDVDADGWTDLIAGGTVWRNERARAFAKLADVGSVVAADFDNDGFPDLFSFSRMKLFRNESGERFTEVPLPDLLRRSAGEHVGPISIAMASSTCTSAGSKTGTNKSRTRATSFSMSMERRSGRRGPMRRTELVG